MLDIKHTRLLAYAQNPPGRIHKKHTALVSLGRDLRDLGGWGVEQEADFTIHPAGHLIIFEP